MRAFLHRIIQHAQLVRSDLCPQILRHWTASGISAKIRAQWSGGQIMANPMDLQLGCGVRNGLVVAIDKQYGFVPVIRLQNMNMDTLKRHVRMNKMNIHAYQTTVCQCMCVHRQGALISTCKASEQTTEPFALTQTMPRPQTHTQTLSSLWYDIVTNGLPDEVRQLIDPPHLELEASNYLCHSLRQTQCCSVAKLVRFK